MGFRSFRFTEINRKKEKLGFLRDMASVKKITVYGPDKKIRVFECYGFDKIREQPPWRKEESKIYMGFFVDLCL